MTKMVGLNHIAIIIVLLAAAAGAWGYTAQEHFNYPNGTDIQGQSGGTGWTNVWTSDADGTYVVTNLSMTYPGITSSGGSAIITPAAINPATSTIYRQLEQPFTNNDVFCVGFIAQKTITNEFSRYFGVALFGTTERTLIGQQSGYANWTINQVVTGTGTNTLDSGLSSQIESYLLLKVAMNSSGAETVTFWVNPNFSLMEAQNTPIGGTSYLTTTDIVSITRIRIGGGGFSDPLVASPHRLDEILLTTNTPFNIPEPSSVALVLAGVAVIAATLAARSRR